METLALFTCKGKAQRPEGRRVEISRGTEQCETSFEGLNCNKGKQITIPKVLKIQKLTIPKVLKTNGN